jgi:N-acetylglucosaminyldiphosphoundecaprenol N-acetyl-beta-D-mannosaminyltransferase
MASPAASTILGIRVDNVTFHEALARIEEYLTQGGTHQVNTVNPEFIITAQDDPQFARILNQSALNLPDGQGLIWAARLLGQPLRQRVTGVDTLLKLAALSARNGYRIYLLGGAEGVAATAGRQLVARFPGLAVAGTDMGSPAPEDEQTIATGITSTRPDILFVAYGAPQQEKWIARNLPRLGVPVAMGVGGAFDFLSGRAKRAPHWMQRLGLEWLHRLLHQPWRWRRMLALPRFALLVLRERLRSSS